MSVVSVAHPASAELLPMNVSPACPAAQLGSAPQTEPPPAPPAAAESARVFFDVPHGWLAKLPTQEGPNGLRFDFNHGCRVDVPERVPPCRVRPSVVRP